MVFVPPQDKQRLPFGAGLVDRLSGGQHVFKFADAEGARPSGQRADGLGQRFDLRPKREPRCLLILAVADHETGHLVGRTLDLGRRFEVDDNFSSVSVEFRDAVDVGAIDIDALADKFEESCVRGRHTARVVKLELGLLSHGTHRGLGRSRRLRCRCGRVFFLALVQLGICRIHHPLHGAGGLRCPAGAEPLGNAVEHRGALFERPRLGGLADRQGL